MPCGVGVARRGALSGKTVFHAGQFCKEGAGVAEKGRVAAGGCMNIPARPLGPFWGYRKNKGVVNSKNPLNFLKDS